VLLDSDALVKAIISVLSQKAPFDFESEKERFLLDKIANEYASFIQRVLEAD
jgi:hypothetical protein